MSRKKSPGETFNLFPTKRRDLVPKLGRYYIVLTLALDERVLDVLADGEGDIARQGPRCRGPRDDISRAIKLYHFGFAVWIFYLQPALLEKKADEHGVIRDAAVALGDFVG